MPFAPLLLLLVVVAVDALRGSSDLTLLVDGLTDEVAHSSTAVLAVLALAGPRSAHEHRIFVAAAIVMSVAIDLDHLPWYLGLTTPGESGRPASHSFATVIVLLAAGAVTRRARPVLAGAATGAALHLVRDVATGPGAPLLWPFDASPLRLPYEAYLAVVVVLAIVATLRCRTYRRWAVDEQTLG